MNNKSKGGVCEPCKVLLNNLIVAQFKEEPARSPELKQVIEKEEEGEEEEKEEERFTFHEDEDIDEPIIVRLLTLQAP